MFGSYSLQELHEDIINTQTEIKIDVAYVKQAIIQIQRDVKNLNMLAKTLGETQLNIKKINNDIANLNEKMLKIEKMLE